MSRTRAADDAPPRLWITAGEPAGIGPDLLVEIAGLDWPASVVAVGDPQLFADRAAQLGRALTVEPVDGRRHTTIHRPGTLAVHPLRLAAAVIPGRLDTANSAYVLETLEQAARACVDGDADALVTGPVHKGVINDAGIPFSGHTEFLAALTAAPLPVMMLAAGRLRVALVTTHLPLREVPAAITAPRVEQVLRILDHDLRHHFGIADPVIAVCGLNPHAGEGGHLGREEIDILAPVIERLRAEGLRLEGPLPADTVFVPGHLARADAVLAMYHDQGLPVLKHAGFGEAVNVTLGLPIIRTSVDHGTALDLAGRSGADGGSLRAAMTMAIELANRSRRVRESA